MIPCCWQQEYRIIPYPLVGEACPPLAAPEATKGQGERHRRSGRPFQNLYKSVLCQEDAYLLNMARCIHLNPIRAGIAEDLNVLGKYPYSGHSVILETRNFGWQDTDTVLRRFGAGRGSARRKYKSFVEKGLSQGRGHDLIGGGMIRSFGGWGVVKAARKTASITSPG